MGKLTTDGQYRGSYHGEILIDAKAEDITKGIMYNRPVHAPQKHCKEPDLGKIDCAKVLLALLADANIASQKPIYENYDKQVQGRTIIERGLADAGVIQPFNSQD